MVKHFLGYVVSAYPCSEVNLPTVHKKVVSDTQHTYSKHTIAIYYTCINYSVANMIIDKECCCIIISEKAQKKIKYQEIGYIMIQLL